MNKTEQQLRDTVRKLFEAGKIDVLVGFENGSMPGRTRPCIIRSAADADRLVWNNACTNNLSVYLVDFFRKKPVPRGQTPPPPPRVGIVLKGCDALSVALLVRENQVPRDSLVLIGMPCQGIVDPATGAIFPSCEECVHPVADTADISIPGESRKPAPADFARVREFEKKSSAERWQYFLDQIDKCIRCYACREVCPNCYCKECFAEKTNPRWIGIGNDRSDTMLYHLGRMFHQAGRCVGCDACVRACPMGVDLRTFTQKIVKDARELFDFEIGFSSDAAPLLSSFRDSDSNNFITDPEKHD